MKWQHEIERENTQRTHERKSGMRYQVKSVKIKKGTDYLAKENQKCQVILSGLQSSIRRE